MWILSESEDRIINPDYLMQAYIKYDVENDLYIIEAEFQNGEIVKIGSYKYEADARGEFRLLIRGDEKKRRRQRDAVKNIERFLDLYIIPLLDLLRIKHYPSPNYYCMRKKTRF